MFEFDLDEVVNDARVLARPLNNCDPDEFVPAGDCGWGGVFRAPAELSELKD